MKNAEPVTRMKCVIKNGTLHLTIDIASDSPPARERRARRDFDFAPDYEHDVRPRRAPRLVPEDADLTGRPTR